MCRTAQRIVPFVLCGMLSILVVTVVSNAQTTTQAVPPQWVKADPPEVDFGEIATMDSKSATLTLVNTDSQPHTVKSVRPSCGCTAVKFTPDTIIDANGKLDVPLQLSGGASDGPILHKIVTVMVQGQADFTVPLKANAVSYVTVTPMPLDPELHKDGRLTLKSKDGQAFRVLSMQPPVITTFPSEAKPEHEVIIDWKRFIEIGANRRITFYLDHPKCLQVVCIVNFAQDYINDVPRTPPPPPLPPPPPDCVLPVDANLDQLIRGGKNQEAIRELKKLDDLNVKDRECMTFLCRASRAGNVELMTYMLAHGAKVDKPNKPGLTPLMFAAQSKNVEAVRVLLKAGASVKARGELGGTALSWACGLGNPESVAVLIDAGSDVDTVDPITGWTPLIWAAGFGDPASIPILLRAGAKSEDTDLQQGSTALIMAARTGKAEAIKELVKAGAKLEAKDRNGRTALLAAAENSGGTAEKIRILIEAGADIHALDNRQLNALQLVRKRTDIRAPEVIAVLEPMLAAESPPEESALAK